MPYINAIYLSCHLLFSFRVAHVISLTLNSNLYMYIALRSDNTPRSSPQFTVLTTVHIYEPSLHKMYTKIYTTLLFYYS